MNRNRLGGCDNRLGRRSIGLGLLPNLRLNGRSISSPRMIHVGMTSHACDSYSRHASAHLCFAATVTPDGRPNLSPKGMIRVWNHRSLFFLDIASPGTRANLATNPWMELNVVDHLSRRGYRFSGRAGIHTAGKILEEAIATVVSEENTTYPAASVVLLEVADAAPLAPPGYQHVADENSMRALWRERREALDKEFEAHLAGQGMLRLGGRAGLRGSR